MSRIVKGRAREYHSELRVQQADQTRSRILDAALRVMADGVTNLSIPAVAREAGTSVPTIYRHFGTKNELLAALYPHLERRAGLDEMVVPRSIDELRDGVRSIFERIDSFDDLARAAMASPASEGGRRLSMPARLAWARGLAGTIVPKLPKAERERIARLLVVLVNSSALRVWRDHLGASVEEAADDIDWLVRAAVAAARSRAGRQR